MDELALAGSFLHELSPLAKLLAALVYIFTVVSFGKYGLSALFPMMLYPAVLFSVSGIPLRSFFYKLRFVLPLVLAVGVFNPLLDRRTALFLGSLPVSFGMLSMLTLMLKGVLCLMASFLLAASTPFDRVCAAFRKLRVPALLVTLLLLTYRYIAVMLEELSVMTDAYLLRAPGEKGIRFKAWGSFLGQLLLRSMDRAQELYSAMQLRGFTGDLVYAGLPLMEAADWAFLFAAAGGSLLFRFVPVTELLGRLALGFPG